VVPIWEPQRAQQYRVGRAERRRRAAGRDRIQFSRRQARMRHVDEQYWRSLRVWRRRNRRAQLNSAAGALCAGLFAR
jgi:anti-sigma-K factor RskA